MGGGGDKFGYCVNEDKGGTNDIAKGNSSKNGGMWAAESTDCVYGGV